MIEPILVQGDPGTGKSTSLRNFPPQGTLILKPNSKPFPWKGGDEGFKQEGGVIMYTNNLSRLYDIVYKGVSGDSPSGKRFDQVVIEDFSHFINAHTMSDSFRARESGNEAFKRYADMAVAMYKALFESIMDAKSYFVKNGIEEPNTKIIVINHTEEDLRGKAKFRSAGKLLDKEIKPSSYFRIVLHSMTMDGNSEKGKYVFLTQDSSMYEAKSPMDMFDEFIPNDLWAAVKTIREYDNAK